MVKQESGKQEATYDYHRYRKLLAEAVDETKRLELIDLLIQEKARDRLEAQRTSDRVAMTAQTVAKVLGASRRDNLAASERVQVSSVRLGGVGRMPIRSSVLCAFYR